MKHLLEDLVITIVVAVLICVFSVVPSQAVEPQNKGQATARRSLKTIIVDNYQPYTFMNEKGSPDGFTVEIVKAVATAMDLDLEIRTGTWEQATNELERGTIDLLPMMAYSAERDRKFDFSLPHTIAYDAIFHRSGDKSLGTLKDLSGKTVIVMNKDVAHDYLLSSGLSETMRLLSVDSLPEALRALASGRGDAAIMPKLVGIITLRKLNLSKVVEPSPSVIDGYSRPFSFAVKEGDQALLERLNQGLGIIKNTGQYDAIYRKWFGGLEEPRIPWKSALRLISLAGILLLAFAAWNISLKRKVKSRTKDLEAEVAGRKLKEEALRESEDRYRDLVEHSQDLICTHDGEGRLLSVNSWAARVTGYSKEELLRMNMRDLIAPEVRDEFDGYLERIRKHGTAQGMLLIRTRNGERRIWEYNNTLRTEGVSEPVIRGMAQDITERIRAEKALRATTRRLQLAATSGGLGIWEWDIQSDALQWDDRMFELYGISRDTSLKGVELWHKCIHPDDFPAAMEASKAAVRGEKEFDTEFRVVRPDGTVRSLQANAVVIREADGKALRMIGINRDITERRTLEEQFRQSQKMEAVGRLAGGIAHDFNNLLTVITGYGELLLGQVGEKSPLGEEVVEIKRAAERAALLTRQLLAFSRRQVLQPKVLDLNEVVFHMEKMLRRLIGEDVEFRIVFGTGLGSVVADPGQVEQVIVNLVLNARDAIPEGGKIAIETSDVVLDKAFQREHPSTAVGPYVCLAVSDNGMGMSAEVKGHLFEPFFTTKGKGKGTGLGLSTVYGIINQSVGQIAVDSDIGRGTTVRIFLPRVDETPEKLPDAPVAILSGGETVLVVEDEGAVRGVVTRVLAESGYRVLWACDGNEGIRLFEENREAIDLLVTDMVMPGMGGRELASRLEASRPGIKVLYMSGYTDDVINRHGALEAGLAFLQKPFTPDRFLGKVRELLDKA